MNPSTQAMLQTYQQTKQDYKDIYKFHPSLAAEYLSRVTPTYINRANDPAAAMEHAYTVYKELGWIPPVVPGVGSKWRSKMTPEEERIYGLSQQPTPDYVLTRKMKEGDPNAYKAAYHYQEYSNAKRKLNELYMAYYNAKQNNDMDAMRKIEEAINKFNPMVQDNYSEFRKIMESYYNK